MVTLFCERCGRLRNRATGKCVCDDDPSLAVPVEARAPVAANGSAVGTVGGTATIAPPVMVPEQSASLSERMAAQRGRRPDPVPQAEAPAPEPIELGVFRGAFGDLREGIRRFDVRIYDQALVIDRVPGIDPLLAARVAGTLVLGPLGFLLGEVIGRRIGRRARARRLAITPQVETGETVPLTQLVALTVQRYPWGGSVRVAAGRAGARTFRFSRRDHTVNDLAGRFQAAVPNRFSMLPFSNGLGMAYRAGVVVLLLSALLMLAIPVKMIAFPPAKPGDQYSATVRDALGRACPAWRAAPLSGPQLASTARQLRADFEAAAKGEPAFASLRGDIATVEAFAPKAVAAGAPLSEAAAFSAAVDRIDAACAAVGQ